MLQRGMSGSSSPGASTPAAVREEDCQETPEGITTPGRSPSLRERLSAKRAAVKAMGFFRRVADQQQAERDSALAEQSSSTTPPELWQKVSAMRSSLVSFRSLYWDTQPNGEEDDRSVTPQHLRRKFSRNISEDLGSRQASCATAAARLAALTSGEKLKRYELEEELKDLIFYKNRNMRARLLHHAVWVSAQEKEDKGSTVRLVLEAKAMVTGEASYMKGTVRNQLQAIHIAAGLGCIPAMEALVEKVDDPVALVNTYCVLHPESDISKEEKFYTPLHDAAYLGQKDAVIWLLERKANAAAQNIEGYSALHWLAVKGHDDREADLEVMVRSLLKHKAPLDTRTHSKGKLEGKIPLELAAADNSHYPRRLLYLLAPSFQKAPVETAGSSPASDDTGRFSFFEDMAMLASLNTDAANHLAKQLMETNDPQCLRQVRADAQKENAVDRMADLFHMAPDAATKMLELLLVKPMVQDPGRHPIRYRANLLGQPMCCEYQADALAKNSLQWPEWRFNSAMADLSEQPELAWHTRLIRAPETGQERHHCIQDVDTKAVLLPNILDVDIFMALSCCDQAVSNIFLKLPVQGIIWCMWNHLMFPSVYVELLFAGIDLIAHVFWGLVRTNNADGSVWWAIIFAGLLRDVVNLGWWFWAHYGKWKAHYEKFRAWKVQPAESGGMERPPGLHSLWRPQAFFTSRIIWEIILDLSKATFIWKSIGSVSGAEQNGGRGESQQIFVTTNTVMQLYKMTYTLRLTQFGKKISTILKAFVSEAITEMMMLMFLFFVSVCLAFKMLKDMNSITATGLFVYRGLLFGDGAALDFMGLDPQDQSDSGRGINTVFMLLASLLFNIVIINLTTAVYSSEYDRLTKEEEMDFQRARARYCCELLLGRQKVRGEGEESEHLLVALRRAVGVAALIAALLLFFGGGSFSSSLAAFFMAFAQVTIQALMLESTWFPFHEDGSEGPEEDHFLWICHRADYSEDCQEEIDRTTVQAIVDDARVQLDGKLDKHLERMEKQIDGVQKKVDQRIDQLDTKLDRLMQMQMQVQTNLLVGANAAEAVKLMQSGPRSSRHMATGLDGSVTKVPVSPSGKQGPLSPIGSSLAAGRPSSTATLEIPPASPHPISTRSSSPSTYTPRGSTNDVLEVACERLAVAVPTSQAVAAIQDESTDCAPDVEGFASAVMRTTVTASAGAAVGGTTGGTMGTLTGAAIGIVPAFFTFGLSIPIGAGIGFCTGVVAGSAAGAVGGGVAGYTCGTEVDDALRRARAFANTFRRRPAGP